MKIKDFQLKIAAALNTVEALVQGGCKALAEDLLPHDRILGRLLEKEEGGPRMSDPGARPVMIKSLTRQHRE